MSSSIVSSRTRALKTSCFGSLITLVCLVSASLGAVRSGDAVVNKYKPIAMDESWKVVGPDSERLQIDDNVHSTRHQANSIPDELDRPHPPRTLQKQSDHSLSKLDKLVARIQAASSELGLDASEHEKLSFDPRIDRLSDIRDWDSRLAGERKYKLPRHRGQVLSKVLDARNKDKTTFVIPKIQRPKVGKFNETDGKLIARYQILVPIFIPALKKKTNSTKKPVEFVKEVVTEMVPIKQIVPHMKEVVKAEPIPQRLVTDFVQSDGRPIPSGTNDKILPGERVVSSIVQNID